MTRLQACASCGSQFDVGDMVPGQRFTCGACHAVVVVGAAAPLRMPVRAAAPPPPPPPPAHAVRSRARAAADRERGSRAGPRERTSRGPSAGVMVPVGVAVLALAIGALWFVRKGDSRPAGAPSPLAASGAAGLPKAAAPPPVKVDSLATLAAEWAALVHPVAWQCREYMGRARHVAGGDGLASKIAEQLIREFAPDDKEAHALLGHREFTLDVPEEISFRKYPFVRVVEEARAQRWLDDESYALTMAAYEKTLAHAKRLTTDRVYASLDVARRGIDRDEYFRQYNYDAIFASPYLICYSGSERLDEAALVRLSKAERARKFADLDARRESYRKILAEKAKIFPQVYAEFVKRYGTACALKPLMDPFGGRPDYPPGVQTYREGCPLIVWIFSDKKAFTEYHEKVRMDPIASGVAGYFSPSTGWVCLYDEDKTDREFEVNKNVHEGTHQLVHWFAAQRNEWRRPMVAPSFFGEGFAEYLGSVTMAKDRTLSFRGMNRPRLQELRLVRKTLAQQNRRMPVFPLKELTAFEGYANVREWGMKTWSVHPDLALGLFYIQSWAFVYFLNEAAGEGRRAAFSKYLADMLDHPRGAEGYAFERFARRFELQSDAAWAALQKEFDAFYDRLIKTDDAALGPKPPARDDWPGYVPPGVDGAEATSK